MKRHPWILSLALIILLGQMTLVQAQAKAPVKPEAAVKPIVAPFEILKSGHMTVTVKVNGQGPYKLIFDTGAPITLINNRVARLTGLLKGVPRPVFSPFGSMGEVKIKTLQVGDARVEDSPAVVMDHPAVDALSKAFGQIDGIVGFPFFARFKMTLDYQAKTMTLVPNGYKPPDVMRAMMAAMLTGGSDTIVLAPRAQLGIVPRKEGTDAGAGVTIQQVMPGSAAAKAGLKEGDRLLTLDDRWTDSIVDLYHAADHLRPGEAVEVKIKRDNKEMKVKLTPGAGL